ncbi:MAG: hypothetical protein ACTSRG_17510 [Candidatus Helarchaeota archaeon]
MTITIGNKQLTLVTFVNIWKRAYYQFHEYIQKTKCLKELEELYEYCEDTRDLGKFEFKRHGLPEEIDKMETKLEKAFDERRDWFEKLEFPNKLFIEL